MTSTLWWWLLVGALAVLFNAQLKAAWATASELFVTVARDAQQAFGGLRQGAVQLVEKAGPVDPVKALGSFVLVGLAAFTFQADLALMRQSMLLVAPWPESAQLLAVTLVSLTAGMGFLLHHAQGWLARCVVLVLALTLLGSQFLIAQERVGHLIEMERSLIELGDPSPPPIFVAGERVELEPEAPAPQPTTVAEPRYDRRPVLGGIQAFQFAAAEIVLLWGIMALGAAAICWAVAGPFLLLFAGLGAGAHLSARLAEAAGKTGEELFGILEVLRSGIHRATKIDLGHRLHQWRLTRKQRRYERDQRARELRAEADRREAERAQAAARDRHQHQQQAQDRELESERRSRERELSAFLARLPAEVVTEFHSAFVEELAARARKDREPQLKHIVERLDATVTALYERIYSSLVRSGLILAPLEDQEATQ